MGFGVWGLGLDLRWSWFFLLLTSDSLLQAYLVKKSWEFESKRRQQPFYASTAVTEKFVIAGSRDKKVYAMDRVTGQEKWNFVTEGNVDASPVVVGNRVYVGCMSTTAEFYVLDLNTGKQVQLLTLDSAVTGSVATTTARARSSQSAVCTLVPVTACAATPSPTVPGSS